MATARPGADSRNRPDDFAIVGRSATAACPEGPMPTVLIVDDELHIRLLIEQTLEALEDDGVQLQTAGDGEAALDVARNHRPELVFLDVMLPRLNGFEVCRAIKEDLGLAATTVVMLTARGQAYDREQGLAAGADRYVTKPFDPDELLDIARAALGLRTGP